MYDNYTGGNEIIHCSKKLRRRSIQALIFAFAIQATYASSTIYVDEKETIKKVETPIHKDINESALVGEVGETGNAIQIKGYLDEKSLVNQGTIIGGIEAVGNEDLNSPTPMDDYSSSFIVDGLGNGVSSMAFTSYTNEKDAHSLIEDILNNGIIKGISKIAGGISNEWANIEAYVTGNGISSYSVIDYGIESKGTDGSGGGSYAMAMSSDMKAKMESELNSNYKSSLNESDIFGKNNISEIKSIENTGLISGSINAKGGTIVDGEYPEFASTTATSSGNGISSYALAFTPDSATFAEEKVNHSIIGSVNNSGTISGEANLTGGTDAAQAYTKSYSNGNGISSAAYTSNYAKNSTMATIDSVTNSGTISGEASIIAGNNNHVSFHEYADAYSEQSGNGISVYAAGTSTRNAKIDSVENTGIISGYTSIEGGTAVNDEIFYPSNAYVDVKASGNGISVQTKDHNGYSSLGDIDNQGIIRGHAIITPGTDNINDPNGASTRTELSGNGISVKGSIDSIINNTGLIAGSEAAIGIGGEAYSPSSIEEVNNYGVLAGQEIYGESYFDMFDGDYIYREANVKNENNQGIYVHLDDKGNVIAIENGKEGTTTIDDNEFTVINGTVNKDGTDSEILISKDTSYDNTIINGAGVENGSFNVKEGTLTLNNSIVNAYETAIKLNDNTILEANNTTFNGGGLLGEDSVIQGDSGKNTVALKGNTIVNGNIDLGNGNDSLTIEENVVLNGDLIAGEGEDKLSLVDSANNVSTYSSNPQVILSGNIDGFDKINVETDTTLTKTAKISGTNSITLDDSTLSLEVDTSIRDEEGNITGHALYSDEDLSVDGDGSLNVKAATLNPQETIALGDDTTLGDDVTLETNSIIHGARLDEEGNIYVTVTELPNVIMNNDKLDYNKLDSVYQSYLASWKYDGENHLANTVNTDDKNEEETTNALHSYLNQVYANNIYGYAPKLSLDSIRAYENISKSIKTNSLGWDLKATGLYSQKKHRATDDYAGDISEQAMTDTYGFLVSSTYGITDTKGVSINFVGAKQDTDLHGDSKLEGDSFYSGLGLYNTIGNLGITAGLGYQRNMYDGNRVVDNGYDRDSFSDSFSTDTFNTYLEARYSYVNNAFILSPIAGLGYTYVMQESVSESGNMALDIDTINIGVGNVNTGVEVSKDLILTNSKLHLKARTIYIYSYGDTSKELNAKFINGSDFNVAVSEINSSSFTTGISADLINNNGTSICASFDTIFSEASESEYRFTLGAGKSF